MPTRYAPGKYFDPQIAETMREAFEAACRSLEESGSINGTVESVRETLALRIIDTAQAGERDVDRLRDDALKHLASVNRTCREHSANNDSALFGGNAQGSRS
jgi:uncharacterized protein Yka (UPF0111/DUF47 family)